MFGEAIVGPGFREKGVGQHAHALAHASASKVCKISYVLITLKW